MDVCQAIGESSGVAVDILGALPPGFGTMSCTLFAPACPYALALDSAAQVAAMPGASLAAQALGSSACAGVVEGLEAVGTTMTEVTTTWTALPSEIACYAAGPACPMLLGF